MVGLIYRALATALFFIIYISITVYPTDWSKITNKSVLYTSYRYFDPVKKTACKRLIEPGKSGYTLYYGTGLRLLAAVAAKDGRRWIYQYKDNVLHMIREQRKDGVLWKRWLMAAPQKPSKCYYYHGYRSPFKEEHYTYRNGKLFMIKSYLKGKLQRYSYFRYHPTGELLVEAVYNGNGHNTGHVVYRNDRQGRVIEELHYSWGVLRKIYTMRWRGECRISRSTRKARSGDPARDPFYRSPH